MFLENITVQKSVVFERQVCECPPKDQRRKHSNRPHKISDETKDLMKQPIHSFNGRGSHYSLHDTYKKYLSDYLNIVDMHNIIHLRLNSLR